MSLSVTDRVAAFEAQAAAEYPADALAVFAGERALQGAKHAAGLPAPGTPMPDGDLLDAHGRATTLTDARGSKPAVVVFYRGAWCPYCNLVLRAYEEDLLPELATRGVALIAISPQKPDGALSVAETNALTYTVLSDPGNQIAGPLGILTETGEAAAAVQAQLGLVVADTNADGTAAIPMPTVVVVDADGAIRWIDVHPDYGTRTEPTEILKRVADLTR
jgi:peroxiredoxin